MQHSLVLQIHVCALRYEELNRRRMTSSSCQMNWSLTNPVVISVTSRPSLDIPRSKEALDQITYTQQLQDNNQNRVRYHAHDPQHHRHRHRHQLNAEMQHSPVLHIHVCALRYEELNRQRITIFC